MAISNVLALATGDASDAGTVSYAAELTRASRGKLLIVYVIKIRRSLPVDAEVDEQVARGEQALKRAQQLSRLARSSVETQLLQAREIGPAVVHEVSTREVDAVVIGMSYQKEHGRFSLGGNVPYILEHSPSLVILYREPQKRTAALGERSLSLWNQVRGRISAPQAGFRT